MIMDDYYRDEIKQLILIEQWQSGGLYNRKHIYGDVKAFQDKIKSVDDKKVTRRLSRFASPAEAFDSIVPTNPKLLRQDEYRFKVFYDEKKLIYLTRMEIVEFLGINKHHFSQVSKFKVYLYDGKLFRTLAQIEKYASISEWKATKLSKRYKFSIPDHIRDQS